MSQPVIRVSGKRRSSSAEATACRGNLVALSRSPSESLAQARGPDQRLEGGLQTTDADTARSAYQAPSRLQGPYCRRRGLRVLHWWVQAAAEKGWIGKLSGRSRGNSDH